MPTTGLLPWQRPAGSAVAGVVPNRRCSALSPRLERGSLLPPRTMVQSIAIDDYVTRQPQVLSFGGHMSDLQNMIDELSERAAASDLIALLATSQQARCHNALLALEMRDVVRALKMELDRCQASALRQSNEIGV